MPQVELKLNNLIRNPICFKCFGTITNLILTKKDTSNVHEANLTKYMCPIINIRYRLRRWK